MVRGAFRAMGTRVEVLVPAGRTPALSATRRLFGEWEAALSRFDPGSDLSRINRGEAAVAGPVLGAALRAALVAAWWTGGLYDPGLGAQVAQAGYDRSFDDVPPAGPAHDTPALPGGAWRGIRLRDDGRLRTPPGLLLDLGGIAKGLAADAAAAALRRDGVTAGMINAGGDLVVWGRGPSRGAWPIAMREAPGAPAVPLRRGALATSGTSRRRWERGGRTMHHVIDPRTGRPAATDLRAASVVADRCADAEAAATAALVLGSEEGTAFLLGHGLHGLLVPVDGPPRPVGAWPSPRAGVRT